MYQIQNIRYFTTLLLVVLALTVMPIVSLAEIIELPDIGSTADAVLSVEEEKRLGKAFIRSARQFYKIVDDPLINNYIQSLGNQLTSHIENSPFDFTFFVVDDPSINAFAGPGGYIGVNTGTIPATESESELASVIAHEIAHVTQRHMQRSFEKASKLSLRKRRKGKKRSQTRGIPVGHLLLVYEHSSRVPQTRNKAEIGRAHV